MSKKLSDGTVELRPWRERDAEAIVECMNGDDEIARWLDRVPQPYTLQDAVGDIRSDGEEKYAVTDAATGRVLGSIGLTWGETRDVVEIGYWARADARGRGVMTRALRLASVHALRSGADRVQLRADVLNVSSRRVAEKAGFTLEGVLRSAHWNPRLGRRQDWAMYSLLPGDAVPRKSDTTAGGDMDTRSSSMSLLPGDAVPRKSDTTGGGDMDTRSSSMSAAPGELE
jgi:RimJ/RimL family protein N-acetyltransferase